MSGVAPTVKNPFLATTPRWPDYVRSRANGGRLIGVPGAGVWLYRKVPMQAVRDAKTTQRRLTSGQPLAEVAHHLAGLVATRGVQRRAVARSNYRPYHLLAVDVERYFDPPADHPRREQLKRDFGHRSVEDKLLLFGVRLNDRVFHGGWKESLLSAADTARNLFAEDNAGPPLSDYDADYEEVSQIMADAGLRTASAVELRLARSWYTYGGVTDPTFFPAEDCVGVVSDPHVARATRRQFVDVPREDQVTPSQWPPHPDRHVLSMAAASDIELDFTPATDFSAEWGISLMEAGAVAVSVRGLIEPPKITRREIERQEKRYLADIKARAESGKLDRDDLSDKVSSMESIASLYGTNYAPATSVDTSIVVAFDRPVENMTRLLKGSSLALNPMTNRQDAAVHETMLCSNIRANPHLLDIPITVLSHSGLMERSRVGDAPRNGAALLGFTEKTGQPAWIDSRAAYQNDVGPLFLAAGATGVGKTQVLLTLAHQWAEGHTPVIIVDPKEGSDLSEAVLFNPDNPDVPNPDNQVISLDELVSADGVFDPFRYAIDRTEASKLASGMLQAVNPWGDKLRTYEQPIGVALKHGLDQGANCIGQALEFAQRDGVVPKNFDNTPDTEMVDRVLSLARSNSLFNAMCGLSPTSQALRAAKGITYIKVGKSGLKLPPADADRAMLGLDDRVTVSLVRLMVTASATALNGRDGVVMLDEAWVFMGAGNTELVNLSRLARSMRVTVWMFTQRVSDATASGLEEHISGGLILPLDEVQAVHACRMLKLEPTKERIERITASAKKAEDDDDGDNHSVNRNSMRALYKPGTREVQRGAIALYADLNGRVVPTEVVLPTNFLKHSSTNPLDIARREAEKSERARALVGTY